MNFWDEKSDVRPVHSSDGSLSNRTVYILAAIILFALFYAMYSVQKGTEHATQVPMKEGGYE